MAAAPGAWPALIRILAVACAPVVLILLYFRVVEGRKPAQVEPKTTTPTSAATDDECARIGGGVCDGDSMLRLCRDGAAESVDCRRLGMRCLRDVCGSGAQCCSSDAEPLP